MLNFDDWSASRFPVVQNAQILNMKKHPRSGIRYLVIDHQRRLFNLFGPMHDDSEITGKVAALLTQGRSISIVNEERVWLSDAEVISDAEAFHRSAYTKESIF